MTRIHDDPIWITNDPAGGDTDGRGSVLGTVIGAAADAFLGNKNSSSENNWNPAPPRPLPPPSPQEIERLRRAADGKEKTRLERKENLLRRNAGLAKNRGWLMADFRKHNAMDGNMQNRVFNRTHRFMQNLRKYEGQNHVFSEMYDNKNDPHFAIKADNLKWRGPDGQINDHSIIQPGQLDLGFGGDYKFDMVWDESLPEDYRSAMAHLHRRLAQIYAVPANEAAGYVVNEYANPGMLGENLGSFEFGRQAPTKDLSRVDSILDNYISEYGIVNIMAAEYKRLREFGSATLTDDACKSPEALLEEVANNIRRLQGRREEIVYKHAYLSTRSGEQRKIDRALKKMLVEMEQSPDDVMDRLERQCRVDEARARRESELVHAREDLFNANSDRSQATMVLGGGSDKKTVANIENDGVKRVVKAGRASPASRDALSRFRERARASRELPPGDDIFSEPGPSSSRNQGSRDDWEQVGRQLSEMALGERQGQAAVSWSDWTTVGCQISQRITGGAVDQDEGATLLARYFCTCWDKMKNEAPPTQCVDVFRDHAWEVVKDAASALLAATLAGGNRKSSAKLAGVKAAIDLLRATLSDEHCGWRAKQHKVDKCAADMYKAATQDKGE